MHGLELAHVELRMVTEIVADPADCPVAKPLESIVAIEVFDDDQSKPCIAGPPLEPSDIAMVAANCCVGPIGTVAEFGVITRWSAIGPHRPTLMPVP